MKSSLLPKLVFPFLVAALHDAGAITVTNSATKDNTLYETGSSSEFLSDGAGQTFTAGRIDTKNGGYRRRAVLAFGDLVSVVPAGATITNVTLQLYMEQSTDATTYRPVTLHRLLANWGEGTSDVRGGEGKGAAPTPGDATWYHRFYNTNFWTTPGGDFLSAARATSQVANVNGYCTWSSSGLVADVQAWLDSPGTNFGWLVAGDETTTHTARQFSSRQSSTVSRRPVLIVQFTIADPLGACALPGGSCASMTSNQCYAAGGTWAGPNTLCPPPTGACCLTNGVCTNVTAAQCAALAGTYQGDNVPCTSNLCPVLLAPFVDPLPVPAAYPPISGVSGGAAYYEVSMQEFSQKLHRDLPSTRVWGYAGAYPGPLIVASNHQPVTVKWINDLRDASGNLRTNHYLPVDTCLMGPDTEGATPRAVVHLHGGHVPPESDGYPEETILPGQTATNIYPNLQPAAMIWFHDHALGITRLNVYMGLAGLYILHDAAEAALGLPAAQYDIPLVIQDRQFNPDGSLSYPATWSQDFFGDKILVNGKVWPYLNVNRGKYRFRILNGSNSRSYALGLASGASFQQIGTDDGLLPAPVSLSQLRLGPGERADTVFDFSSYVAGTEIVLTNGAPAPYPGSPGVGVIPNVMKFVVQGSQGHTNALPGALVPVPPISTNLAVAERTFFLQKTNDPCTGERWQINGLGWEDITEFPELGTTEIWSFVNKSGMSHPMHMHLVAFQVLDRQPFVLSNDVVVTTGPRVAPAANEAGWKDTVQVTPYEIVRVIATFEDFRGKYPYHCHILEHEDHEMMRQFQVVAFEPAVTSSPTNRTVLAGQSTSFTLSASGTAPLRYQWWFNNGPISGATNSTYALPSAQVGNAGSYYAIVTNVAGSATSAIATLTVWEAPSITSSPTNRAVIAGQSTTFVVGASATPAPAYQWWFNYTARAGATAASYTVTTAQAADAGSYYVIVTNVAGRATSDVATLTVYVPAYVITPPASRTVPSGTNVQFSVLAGGTEPLSYQWLKNTSALPGRTADSLSLSNVTLPDSGSYSVLVTNSYGRATSAVAILTVTYEESTLAFWATTNELLVLRWIGPDWRLQSSPDLAAWGLDPAVAVQEGFTNTVMVPLTNAARFFRLLKP